jgi:hypothetical protein
MGFFSGESETTQQTDPWGPSKRPLKEHLQLIQGQDPWSVYGGQQQANFNQDQLGMMQGVRDFMGGMGGNAINSMYGMGNQLMGGFGQAQNAYQNMLGQGAVQNQGPNMDLVGQMTNNPHLQGQIDMAHQDVTNNLYQNQMPGIAAYSGGSGNLGSSRRGMLEGLAQNEAAGRMSNISTQMRGQQYGNALNYANQIANQNAALNQQNRGMQMQAANQLGGLGAQGAGLFGQGQNMWGQQNQWLGNIGQQQQDWTQTGLNNQMNNHYLGQMLPYQQAQMGVGIGMGPGQAFGETTGTTPNGGIFGGIMAPIMGMAGGYMAGGGKVPGMGG